MKKKIGSIRKAPNLVITPLSNIEVEDLLKYEPILDLVRSQASIGIERAISENKEDATIVQVNSSGYYVEIPRKYWNNALTTCLEYYCDLEDFEKCTQIQAVQKKLIEYDKIPSSLRTKHKKKKYERE